VVKAAWLLAFLVGCSWADFDDLSDQTWVTSTEKPNVKSSDYGVAIQRGARTGSGGTLVVIGAGQATYSELSYQASGKASLAPTALELNSQFGIGNLDAQPILIADPTSDDVSLVVNSGGNAIAVLTGTGQINVHQVFGPSQPDAATYMQPPNRLDNGMKQPVQPLVASGDTVFGTFFMTPPNPQPKCQLVGAAGDPAVAVRGLGTVVNGTVDDVIVWAASGKLYKYPSSVFNGCATTQAPALSSPMPPPVAPGHFAQILTVDATHVLLQGHGDADETGFLQVYDAGTLMPIGAAITLPKLKTATVLTQGTKKFAVAGYPTEPVGGQVRIFEITASGLAAQPAETLSDAQPDNNHLFGRAVAAMPFNDTQIVVVAADNEIYSYFRTQLYDETRQGR